MSNIVLPSTVPPEFNPHLERRPEDFLTPKPVSYTLTRAKVSLKQALGITYPLVDYIDLSKWNIVNLDNYGDSGGKILMAKVTEGVSTLDYKWQYHWQAGLDNGFLIQPYHFMRFNQDAIQQAEWFLEKLQPFLALAGGIFLPPTLDVETTDGVPLATRQSRYATWMGFVRDNLREPCKYSSPAKWNTIMGNYADDYFGMVAHWTPNDYPAYPTGWSVAKTKFWQYGIWDTYPWCTAVPGANPDIDRDRFFGTYEEAQALAGVTFYKSKLARLLVDRKVFTEPSTTAPVAYTEEAGVELHWDEELYKPQSGATFLRVSYSKAPLARWIQEKDSNDTYVERFES